ncbi:hypothetical protein ACTXT7_004311 [Hymenolepis weldensis]
MLSIAIVTQSPSKLTKQKTLKYLQSRSNSMCSEVLDIYLHYEEDQAVELSVGTGDETSSLMSSSSGRRTNQQGLANSTSHSNSPGQFTGERDSKITLVVRTGVRQWAPGYQPSLVCRIAVPNLVSSPPEPGDSPYPTNFSPISAIALTSATNL